MAKMYSEASQSHFEASVEFHFFILFNELVFESLRIARLSCAARKRPVRKSVRVIKRDRFDLSLMLRSN